MADKPAAGGSFFGSMCAKSKQFTAYRMNWGREKVEGVGPD